MLIYCITPHRFVPKHIVKHQTGGNVTGLQDSSLNVVLETAGVVKVYKHVRYLVRNFFAA